MRAFVCVLADPLFLQDELKAQFRELRELLISGSSKDAFPAGSENCCRGSATGFDLNPSHSNSFLSQKRYKMRKHSLAHDPIEPLSIAAIAWRRISVAACLSADLSASAQNVVLEGDSCVDASQSSMTGPAIFNASVNSSHMQSADQSVSSNNCAEAGVLATESHDTESALQLPSSSQPTGISWPSNARPESSVVNDFPELLEPEKLGASTLSLISGERVGATLVSFHQAPHELFSRDRNEFLGHPAHRELSQSIPTNGSGEGTQELSYHTAPCRALSHSSSINGYGEGTTRHSRDVDSMFPADHASPSMNTSPTLPRADGCDSRVVLIDDNISIPSSRGGTMSSSNFDSPHLNGLYSSKMQC